MAKSSYKEEYNKKAFNYFAEYHGDKIALGSIFNVSYRTILYWEKKHPEFSESIQKGMQKKVEWLNELCNMHLKSGDKSFNVDLWRYSMNATKRQVKCFDKLDFKDPVKVMEILCEASVNGEYPMAISEVKSMIENLAKIYDAKTLGKLDELEERVIRIKKAQKKLDK